MTHPVLHVRVTFREGGAFDFHSTFEQIKERLYNAVTIAREHGTGGSNGVDLTNVDLEQLPAYEPAPGQGAQQIGGSGGPVQPPTIDEEAETRNMSNDSSAATRPPKVPTPIPDEPPPIYEEAQAQAVGEALDESTMEEAERRGG